MLYSNTDICYHCGCSDDMTVADSAYPICARCISDKKKPKKKPKKFVPKIEQVQIVRLIFIIELHKSQIPNSTLFSKHLTSNECFFLNECPSQFFSILISIVLEVFYLESSPKKVLSN